MSDVINCNVCGSSIKKIFPVKEQMFGFGHLFRYGECEGCGGLQCLNIPENLSAYYPENYYSFGKTARPVGLIKRIRRGFKRWLVLSHPQCMSFALRGWLSRYEMFWIYRELGLTTKMRVLDVGAGGGTHVDELRSAGVRGAIGVDPFIDKDVVAQQSTVVLKGSIWDVTETFDLIVFHHSLEHMQAQPSVLSRARALLSPRGLILIRVPTVTSHAYRHYQEHWFSLDAPRHLFLHSHTSIRLMVEQAGFRLVKLWCDSNENQFIFSEQYKKNIPLFHELSYRTNPINSGFSHEQLRHFKAESRRLNQDMLGDQICVVCQPN